MKKIAMVVHRYEKKIGSGAENLAMMYALRLKSQYRVEVLTSTCLDTESWENSFLAGESNIDGIVVRRFPTEHGRESEVFYPLSITQADKLTNGEPTDYEDDRRWIEAQGPDCPQLLQYLDEHRDEYTAFLFFTYLYYPTVLGLPRVAEKAILFPTAHDEIWIRQGIYQELFSMPRCLGFLTPDEESFVRGYFHNDYIPSLVVGCGVDCPQEARPSDFREKFQVKGDYLLYVGRIEPAKGCDELITQFISYKKTHPSELKLVLMGRGDLEVPKREDIITTGFVSEQEKWDGIFGAKVVLAPSPAESLCIALLEGLSAGVPGLVNGKCTVLKNHCIRGQCGYSYTNAQEFIERLDELLNSPSVLEKLGNNAKAYIARDYRWDTVIDRLERLIEYTAGNSGENLLQENTFDADIQPTKPSYRSSPKAMGRNIFADQQCIPEVIYATPDTALEPAFSESVTALFVASDSFASHLGVLLHSIIVNADTSRCYELVVMQTDMTVKSMNLLHSLGVGHNNISIRFVDVNHLVDSDAFLVTGKNYNYFTFYRLLLPHLMRRYPKVLYLDADILANADIAKLYDEDVSGFDMAGTYDITVTSWMSYDNEMSRYFSSIGLTTPGKYLQAGVILFNVEEMNRRFTPRFLLEKACQERYLLNDQDLLNVYSKGHIRFLPLEWNVFVLSEGAARENQERLPEVFYREYVQARQAPKLIHYTEKQFPDWVPNCDMGALYWSYARGTPFYEEMLLEAKR